MRPFKVYGFVVTGGTPIHIILTGIPGKRNNIILLDNRFHSEFPLLTLISNAIVFDLDLVSRSPDFLSGYFLLSFSSA